MKKTRIANIKDIDKIYEIEKETFKNPWSKESIYYEIYEDELSDVIVIEENGEVMAYIGYMIIFDEIHIANVAVAQKSRGCGYGKLLLEEICKFADEHDKKLTLEVNVHNDVAISLYKKYGFKSFGTRKNYYGQGEDAHIMWRE